MSDVSRERIRTGNRVNVFSRGAGERKLLGRGFVGGRIGEGQSAGMDIDTGLQPQYTLGTPFPYELVDGRYGFSVNLSLLNLSDRDAADTINAEEVDLDVIDRFSGQKVCTAEQCKVSRSSFQIQANSPIVRNISFMALRIVG